MTHNSVNDKQS